MKALAPEIYAAEMARRGATQTSERISADASDAGASANLDKEGSTQHADPFDDKGKQGLWVAKGQEALEATLSDPGSVKYKNLFNHTATLGLCGQNDNTPWIVHYALHVFATG